MYVMQYRVKTTRDKNTDSGPFNSTKKRVQDNLDNKVVDLDQTYYRLTNISVAYHHLSRLPSTYCHIPHVYNVIY